MTAVKGYLKDAWDLAKALTRDPKQVWSDIRRGDYEARLEEKPLTPQGFIGCVGAGLVMGNLILPDMASGILIPLGLAGVYVGMAKYRSIGEDAREKDEAVDVVREKLQDILKDLEGEFADPAGNGPIIDGTYRVLDRGPVGGSSDVEAIMPPAKPPAQELHI